MPDGKAMQGTGHHDIQDAADELVIGIIDGGSIADADTVKFHALDNAGRNNHDTAPVIGICL